MAGGAGGGGGASTVACAEGGGSGNAAVNFLAGKLRVVEGRLAECYQRLKIVELGQVRCCGCEGLFSKVEQLELLMAQEKVPPQGCGYEECARKVHELESLVLQFKGPLPVPAARLPGGGISVAVGTDAVKHSHFILGEAEPEGPVLDWVAAGAAEVLDWDLGVGRKLAVQLSSASTQLPSAGAAGVEDLFEVSGAFVALDDGQTSLSDTEPYVESDLDPAFLASGVRAEAGLEEDAATRDAPPPAITGHFGCREEEEQDARIEGDGRAAVAVDAVPPAKEVITKKEKKRAKAAAKASENAWAEVLAMSDADVDAMFSEASRAATAAGDEQQIHTVVSKALLVFLRRGMQKPEAEERINSIFDGI